jgi:glycosyltransferase involved in cell wall biosynthesis
VRRLRAREDGRAATRPARRSRASAQPTRVALVALVAAGQSGVGRYASSLVAAIDEVAGEFPGLELSLLTTPEVARALRSRRLAVHETRSFGRRGAGRVIAEQAAAARARADLLHFFDLTGPMLAPARAFTTTAHDVRIAAGDRVSAAHKAYRRALQPWAARRATAVVAVSDFTAGELARGLGAPRERIHVIRSGPGLAGSPLAAPVVRPPAEPFLLYVGDFAENKNLPLLVRAFDAAGVDGRLLLVGRPAGGFEDLRATIATTRARDRITTLGAATDADLDLLYRRAVGLALISRYEGFGFTPLEAMARDCPVIAADIPAIREISGNGALLVSPVDETACAHAIQRLFADESLRASLRERGRATVARYSWRVSGRELCRLFTNLGQPDRRSAEAAER